MICAGTSCGDTQGLFKIYNSNGYRFALQHVSINGYDFLIRYIPISSVDNPYLNIDLFEKASQMLPNQDADMPVYGLMAALSGDLRGVYLMAAIGLDRAELNYRQQYQCSFR